jgi:predicted nuclease with TOPRIM domain
MMAKLIFVAFTAFVLAFLAAACGTSSSTDTLGSASATVDTAAAGQKLQQIATEVQTLVSDQLQQGVSSSSDLTARLDQAQAQLDELAQSAENVETENADLAEARDNLHDALHALSDEVAQLQADVESGNAEQAIQQLMSSQALSDLRAAIQDVKSQSG